MMPGEGQVAARQGSGFRDTADEQAVAVSLISTGHSLPFAWISRSTPSPSWERRKKSAGFSPLAAKVFTASLRPSLRERPPAHRAGQRRRKIGLTGEDGGQGVVQEVEFRRLDQHVALPF
ncbi:MAG: hypothetical protein AB1545_01170 [Thermodesulfobacteriota bacterium]